MFYDKMFCYFYRHLALPLHAKMEVRVWQTTKKTPTTASVKTALLEHVVKKVSNFFANYKEDTYHCLCEDGFIGTYYEKGKHFFCKLWGAMVVVTSETNFK